MLENLSKVEYRIFDASDTALTHKYSSLASQDEQYIKQSFQSERLALLKQTHSNDLVYVDHIYNTQVADAMATDVPGIILGIQTADCVALLLASSDAKVIAALHLGWRGAASDLLAKTLKLMNNFSSSDIYAIFSPCIRQNSYEVNHDFFLEFIALKPSSKIFFISSHHKKDKLLFDLPGFIKFELNQYDVKYIYDQGYDTYGNEKYFSYRFAKCKGLDQTKRILSCINLKA